MALHHAPGTAARIVDGRDTLTLAVPDGVSGRVTAEMSILSWAVAGIAFGLDVASRVADAADSAFGAPANSAVNKFAALLGATTTPDPPMHALHTCLQAAEGLISMNARTEREMLKFAWACARPT